MRLLNAITISFEVFYGDPLPYAILSHTWGREHEEATFQDLRDGTGTDKPGYLKIRACCDQAISDGLDYVWIDTCCIDKTNSVELQEAINSMFRWYKRSKICYAYLTDYSAQRKQGIDIDLFKASIWFTRGWTLQELLAPANVVFWDNDWKMISTKSALKGLISDITRISAEVLEGEDPGLSSIAQRMSWASRRNTTRTEDIAYCLLGIFDVNIPMIYGEGGVAAFVRLQKAIIDQSDDHSLFAWKMEHGIGAHGFLATSPALFEESSFFVRNRDSGFKSAYRMSNRGLEIRLPVSCQLRGGDFIALLGCVHTKDNSTIGIHVTVMEDGRFLRTQLSQLAKIQSWPIGGYKPLRLERIYVPQVYHSKKPIQRQVRFRMNKSESNSINHSSVELEPDMAEHVLPSETLEPQRSATTDFPIRFGFAMATVPGRIESNDLEFKLNIGGRAGVLFAPSNVSDIFRLLPSQRTPFVAAIFGVDLDGSIFGDVAPVLEKDFKETSYKSGRAGIREWLERYTLERRISSSSRSSTRMNATERVKDIGETRFYMKLEPKLVDGNSLWEVSILYHPRRYSNL